MHNHVVCGGATFCSSHPLNFISKKKDEQGVGIVQVFLLTLPLEFSLSLLSFLSFRIKSQGFQNNHVQGGRDEPQFLFQRPGGVQVLK